MADPDKFDENPVNKLLEKPAVIGGLMVVTVIGVAMGWLDGLFGVILLAIGVFGIYRALNKAKSPPK